MDLTAELQSEKGSGRRRKEQATTYLALKENGDPQFRGILGYCIAYS